jgi:hypothetical protein
VEDVGASVDGGYAGEEGEYGAFLEAGVGLEGLGDSERRVIENGCEAWRRIIKQDVI